MGPAISARGGVGGNFGGGGGRWDNGGGGGGDGGGNQRRICSEDDCGSGRNPGLNEAILMRFPGHGILGQRPRSNQHILRSRNRGSRQGFDASRRAAMGRAPGIDLADRLGIISAKFKCHDDRKFLPALVDRVNFGEGPRRPHMGGNE